MIVTVLLCYTQTQLIKSKSKVSNSKPNCAYHQRCHFLRVLHFSPGQQTPLGSENCNPHHLFPLDVVLELCLKQHVVVVPACLLFLQLHPVNQYIIPGQHYFISGPTMHVQFNVNSCYISIHSQTFSSSFPSKFIRNT